MKKLAVILISVTIIILLVILYSSLLTGNPIIPKYYDLTCREKNSGEFITMENSCELVTDCSDWVLANCGPRNGCNNEKIDCKNNKCVKIVYFKFDRSCV